MLLSHRRIFLYVIAFLSLYLMAACQPNTIEDIQPAEPEIRAFPLVDERLWPYFERFEEEARARGENVDLVLSRISGKIEAIDREHVAGLCTTFGNARPGSVTIDATFWNRANDLFKEFIVFHELGHCYLNRGHREDAFSNGQCVSIMRSGTLDCRDNYNGASRTEYISELFKPNVVQLD
ncbi:MAG: hypothetical protein AAGJ18_27700 [Bacteroidota bacterium]